MKTKKEFLTIAQIKLNASNAYLEELRRSKNGSMEVTFPEFLAEQIKKDTGVDIVVDGEFIRLKDFKVTRKTKPLTHTTP